MKQLEPINIPSKSTQPNVADIAQTTPKTTQQNVADTTQTMPLNSGTLQYPAGGSKEGEIFLTSANVEATPEIKTAIAPEVDQEKKQEKAPIVEKGEMLKNQPQPKTPKTTDQNPVVQPVTATIKEEPKNVVHKEKGTPKLHKVKTTDPITLKADVEEENFIKEVELHHTNT